MDDISMITADIEAEERNQIVLRTTSSPTTGSLVELFERLIETAGYSKAEWCGRHWTILTAALKRLCFCVSAVRTELQGAPHMRHIVYQLFATFDDIGDALDRTPVMRGAPHALLFQRAVLIADMTDNILAALVGNNLLNGERKDLSPPWGADWRFFVSNASGDGDINDRVKMLCQAVDVLVSWARSTGRLTDDVVRDKPTKALAADPDERPEVDEEDLSPEALAAIEASVDAEMTPSSEVAEGEAAIAEAVGRAPLLGDGERDITAALESLVDNGMPESEPVELPPPRMFQRRGRPRKDQA